MCNEWRDKKCNHHFPELNKKRKLFRLLVEFFSWQKTASVLVAVSFMIGFVYLVQTNISATKGYEIKDLEQKLEILKEKNDKLNLQYIELQSVANITNEVSNLNLVASSDVDVVTPLGSSVALR